MRTNELLRGSGYLLIFAPLVLLLVGLRQGLPWLSFVALFFVAPLLRVVFGDAPERASEWSEAVATFLHRLPDAYAVLFVVTVGASLPDLHRLQGSIAELVGFGLSLWATFIFASCPAHELAHRRTPGSRTLGRVLAGVLGYPVLEHEHRAHHSRPGDAASAEWPSVDETLWAFSLRRLRRVFRSALDGEVVAAARSGRKLAGSLPLSALCTFATWTAFLLAAGWTGALLYTVVVAAVWWAMQAITYVQHWGLGTDHLEAAKRKHFGWEDRCQVQAWLTLSISFHQAHHSRHHVPYYLQEPESGSPRMPAGYVVLLFAGLVPPAWRALMLPALEGWKRDPHRPTSTGRRLVCFHRVVP